MLYIDSIYLFKARDNKNGPKQRVKTCRLGHKYIFIKISMFIYTNYVLLFYLGTKKVRVCKDNKNRPKQRQMHLLGQRYVFFVFSFCVLCVLTNVFYSI